MLIHSDSDHIDELNFEWPIRRWFDRLIYHFFNPYISNTTNQLENYYRQTDPKKTKNQHKAAEGLLQALNQKAVFWVIPESFYTTVTYTVKSPAVQVLK